MPEISSYTPGSVCPQPGGSCSKLAYWLQVRGTMCGEPEWKPHFTKGRLSEASENAAYAAALDRGNSCPDKANGAVSQVLASSPNFSPPSESVYSWLLWHIHTSYIAHPSAGSRTNSHYLLYLPYAEQMLPKPSS